MGHGPAHLASTVTASAPSDKHETAVQKAARRAASEALYYAWKLGVAGVLPSLVLGNGVIESGKNSIKFVKANFIEIAKLRAAYSLLCWVVGILAYVGAMITLIFMGDEIYALSGGIAIAKIYLYMIVPIAVSVSVVMIFLRPIYVLTICDMYSDYLFQNNEKANLPNNPKNGKKAFIVFVVICALSHDLRFNEIWRHQREWNPRKCRSACSLRYKKCLFFHSCFSYFLELGCYTPGTVYL